MTLSKEQFAKLVENYTDKEQTDMCLMDWEGRDWQV